MAIRKDDPVFNGPASAGTEAGAAEPRVLDGRFELREVIGSGGMATVYRARDRKRDRACAVKVLAENLTRDEEFRERFRQEAEAASALVHPRIVRVYGYGDDADSDQYIAMEFVDGGTLRDLVRRRERLPEGLALRIAAEVADALAYAHGRRVIHRDIKPHNILLTSDQHVKVADFGIARSLDSTSHTRTGTVLGSTQYISPEQAAGQQASQASGQYSLGVVLYEMLAGRLPFDEAETPVAMALKHIHEPPFDLQWLRPDLSQATVAVVRRLLAKSPDERYASAAGLATNLRRIYARLGRDASNTVMLPIRAGGEPQGAAGSPGHSGGPAEVLARGATVRLATPGRRHGGLSDTARRPAISSQRRGSLIPQVAVALIGVTGLWFFASAAYHGHQSAVHRTPPAAQTPGGLSAPPLVGQTLQAAQDFAAAHHLKLAISSRQDPTVGAGVIAAQDPPARTALAQGATITVVVGQGSGAVPDVRGMSADAAAQTLAAAGLQVGSTSYTHDDRVASGTIVSQSANPGAHLTPKTAINLVVSQGPNQASNPASPAAAPASFPGTAVVPNVTGSSLPQAQSQLRSIGLKAGRVSYAYDDRVPAGVVLRQDPATGAQASANDAVNLVVSQGPRPAPQTPAPQPSPPASPPSNPPVQAPPTQAPPDPQQPPPAIP